MNGKVRQSVVSLAFGLVKRAQKGDFNPAVAWEIAGRRKREQQVFAERIEDARRSISDSLAVQEAKQKALAEMRGMLKGKRAKQTDAGDVSDS